MTKDPELATALSQPVDLAISTADTSWNKTASSQPIDLDISTTHKSWTETTPSQPVDLAISAACNSQNETAPSQPVDSAISAAYKSWNKTALLPRSRRYVFTPRGFMPIDEPGQGNETPVTTSPGAKKLDIVSEGEKYTSQQDVFEARLEHAGELED